MVGVVIGAPHSGTAPGTAALARVISDRTGAGFVAAYGFKSQRVSVEQPVVRSNPQQPIPVEPSKRLSVFPELKKLLREISGGELDLYVALRPRHPRTAVEGIEVTASGFTFEEIQVVDRAFTEIRDRFIGASAVEKWPLLIAPVDRVNLVASGIRHHGVLMIAEKGISLRIPEKLLSGANLSVYGAVFSAWIKRLANLVHDDFRKIPRVQVRMMDLGRFDSIPARKGPVGVVIGAPHGTYDEYTAEIVKRLGFRTGLAAVIARGFSPTEAGGWRINVNRPSEKTYLAPEFEVSSGRSLEIYKAFRDTVIDAAGGNLRLYFDVHQYGGSSIQIATVGVSAAQAQNLKRCYQQVRDRILAETPDIERVRLMIEPQDVVEIGAWPAKAHGILRLARKSVHIELPLYSALRGEKSRNLYTRIVAELIMHAVQELGN
jgi:hypothetical protein